MRSEATQPSIDAVILTCEHATCALPAWLRPRFAEANARHLLHTHRGLDIGAGRLARHLARTWQVPLIAGHISRLAVEMNRSLHHRQLFSDWTRSLPLDQKQHLIAVFHAPFRRRTRQVLEGVLQRGTVLHLSIHSFTPVLSGQQRPVEIGLLYDPQRLAERSLARAWAGELRRSAPEWRTRLNQPYHGTADGHTTELRRRLETSAYLGLELEINQKLLTSPTTVAAAAGRIAASLHPFLAFSQIQQSAKSRLHPVPEHPCSRPGGV